MVLSQQIRQSIMENFMFDVSENGFKDTDSFLEQGIIDSTGVIELVSFLEETYNMQVEDEELIPENLDSIANVAAYIEGKRSSQ